MGNSSFKFGLFFIVLIFSLYLFIEDIIRARDSEERYELISSRMDSLKGDLSDIKSQQSQVIALVKKIIDLRSLEIKTSPARIILNKKVDILRDIIDIKTLLYENADFSRKYKILISKLVEQGSEVLHNDVEVMNSIKLENILPMRELESLIHLCVENQENVTSSFSIAGIKMFSVTKKKSIGLSDKGYLSGTLSIRDYRAIMNDGELNGQCFSDVKVKIRDMLLVYEKLDAVYLEILDLIEN